MTQIPVIRPNTKVVYSINHYPYIKYDWGLTMIPTYSWDKVLEERIIKLEKRVNVLESEVNELKSKLDSHYIE